jgi:hypothetical protein
MPKRFEIRDQPWGPNVIEVDENELRVKSSDGWWIRFPRTNELKQFLKDITNE